MLESITSRQTVVAQAHDFHSEFKRRAEGALLVVLPSNTPDHPAAFARSIARRQSARTARTRTSTEVDLLRRRRYAPRGCQVKRSVRLDDQPPEAEGPVQLEPLSDGGRN